MIYFLDLNPEKCAEYHCDSHVISQIPELILMMSNCHEAYGSFDEATMPKSAPLTEYRWIKKSRSNYVWTSQLTTALCNEFFLRYKCYHYLADKSLDFLFNKPEMDDCGLSEFEVEVYRLEYIDKKSTIAQWRYTLKPDWYPEEALQECIAKEDVGIRKYAYERVKHLL